MQTDFAKYVTALNEGFGTEADPAEPSMRIEIQDGPSVLVTFAEDTVTTRIGIDAAHDGLPEPILRELLRLNMPSPLLAGAMLAIRPNRDFLELIDVVPLAAVTPAGLATATAAQAAGAIEISRRVADLSFTMLNPTTEEAH